MLKVGDYIKVTGFEVKNDNDIYIVETQYKEGDYCCKKVKQNGELSATKYNILFLKDKHFNNSNISIEIINKDELKRAKNEVNNFINEVTAEESFYTFVDTNKKEVTKGTFIKVIKSIPLTSSIYNVPKDFIYECTAEATEKANFLFHLLGKRGEKLSTSNANATNKIMLGFRPALVEKLFNEGYIIIVDRIEIKKGDIQKQEKEQTTQEETKEQQQSEQTQETIKNDTYTITADIDTRDNSPLWVVKLVNKVDYEEFKRIEKEVMKPINSYYSRFKGGFIFKYDPTNKLINEVEQEQETIYNNVIEAPEQEQSKSEKEHNTITEEQPEQDERQEIKTTDNNIKIHELNSQLLHCANYNSFNGKRGDLSKSGYESYANKIISWEISNEKKQKLLDELYKKWSEILKYEAQHVSVMVAGPAKYNSKKLDKGDKILELSHYFVEWFKGLEKQAVKPDKTDKATKIIQMIELWDSRTGFVEANMVLSEVLRLASVDSQKFIEYFEKLQPKYKWRKNTNAYKLYKQHKAGEVQEVKKEIIFENADYTAFTEGDRAYIKFTMKPQRQLMVALKSRKWWWNARVNAWSTYLNKLDKEWVSSLSNQYSKYI